MTKHTKDQKLKDFLKDIDEGIVIADGLAHAFVGISTTPDGVVAVYSTERIIAHLMEEDLMDFDTAEEFMHLQIISKYDSDRQPMFIDVVPEDFWMDGDTDKS